jgi:hypothetical protein
LIPFLIHSLEDLDQPEGLGCDKGSNGHWYFFSRKDDD